MAVFQNISESALDKKYGIMLSEKKKVKDTDTCNLIRDNQHEIREKKPQLTFAENTFKKVRKYA